MTNFLAILSIFSIYSILAVSGGANVVCYFASWTIYRPDDGKFQASDVDPSLCTHILYAFVGLRDDGHLSVLDDWEATGLFEIDHLLSLKSKNPNLKILVSMGGWNEGSYKYSTVARDPAKRAIMKEDVLGFIKDHSFDGFDLDWEYPCQRGGEDIDKENFIILLKELKEALNNEGYILSAAVGAGIATIDLSYNIQEVSNNLDLINVMTYDFHGNFENFVGHHAGLYPSSRDRDDLERTLNVASGIQYWLDNGADPSKINLGIGSYGRSFTLADPAHAQLYDQTYGGGDMGPYTRQMGILGYNEICFYNKDWDYIWDDEQEVPHMVKKDQWVGYDDERSIRLKVAYALEKKLGGVMVWSLDTDDFRGLCGNGPYPLLHAINDALSQ